MLGILFVHAEVHAIAPVQSICQQRGVEATDYTIELEVSVSSMIIDAT